MARTQLKERPAQASLLPDPEPVSAAKLPAKPKPTKPEPSKAVAMTKPQPLAKPAAAGRQPDRFNARDPRAGRA